MELSGKQRKPSVYGGWLGFAGPTTELPLEADPQLAESSEPGMGAFDYPAVTPEAFAALDAAPCDAALDAPLA